MSRTRQPTTSEPTTLAASADGFGAGVETTRSYLAEEFPTGSQRNLMRWLASLVGRDDVQRVWLKPTGSKIEIWSHDGTLDELPDLDHLFVTEEVSQIAV